MFFSQSKTRWMAATRIEGRLAGYTMGITGLPLVTLLEVKRPLGKKSKGLLTDFHKQIPHFDESFFKFFDVLC